MINIVEITAKNVTLDDALRKYVTKKIGKLEKLVPKASRDATSARVIFSLAKGKAKMPTCEVIITVPDRQITAKESTINMFSSIDIVEAKLARQIRRYKTEKTDNIDQRSIRRFLGKAAA